ncbi:L,D-transpeptidase family protein [Novosphingobium lentum]|uniref:L,D-transpeptidase family protein n=1 Tax=Novosphingobium lentum TaxID=145287 RepID=UPI00082E986D|nr:L,D-transpeptidase family protein [Novosphingobium lentum]
MKLAVLLGPVLIGPVLGASLLAPPARARAQSGPVDLTAQARQAPKPLPTTAVPASTATTPALPGADATAATVVVPPAPPAPPPHWALADAQGLLEAIQGIGKEGLFARDYQPATLAAAIADGEGPSLDATATKLFGWLAEDLRDGRTPMDSRAQWFVVDPDVDANPTPRLLTAALNAHNVKGVLAGLDPTNPDYALLRETLPKAKDPAIATLIRINMDRWRWLPRDLGLQYLLTNVPEQMLKLTVDNKIITSYRTIVGKPGRTATPQLAVKVQGVIFNPTWTVPQSIVKGEGLGVRLAANIPAAKRQGYAVTKSADGTITVVQQPGPKNSLGLMKLDMPNEHAIFIHDTPNRSLFALPSRALSHGCVRTERASELGMTMAMLGADLTPEQGVEYTLSGKYTRVPMTKTFPVYITYFTMARDVTGTMRSFDDLYGRDAPVLASFAAARQPHTGQRTSKEEVIKLDNPL